MRIHQYLPQSYSNGPGSRFVLWLQGCHLACPQCFNPKTHPMDQGKQYSIADLLKRILKNLPTIEGLTISGGEPLLQFAEVAELVCQIKQASHLSIILLTGFSWDEIQEMPGKASLLANIDVLIAGRYLHSKRIAQGLLGSQNKTIHFLTPRYTMDDLIPVPPAEIIITPQGELICSGIDPLHL